jgi:hypothetical protein
VSWSPRFDEKPGASACRASTSVVTFASATSLTGAGLLPIGALHRGENMASNLQCGPTSQTWALSLPPRGRKIEGPQTLPERVSLAERVGALGAVSAT